MGTKRRQMRLFGSVWLFFLAGVMVWPAVGSAHVVKTDGSIESLLHINPNDEPVAGQKSTLGFSISDSSEKFSAKTCKCRITIKDGWRTLVGRSVTAEEALSPGVILVDYKFPYQAVYNVTLEGAPEQTDGFQKFKLEYDLRVDQGPKKPSVSWLTWAIIGLVGGLVVGAGVVVYLDRRRVGKKHR